MSINPLDKYKATSLKTTDSIGQMLFTFDELIKMLYTAQKAMVEKNYELKHNTIVKITDIITILRSGVNVEAAELLSMLDNFYQSVIYKIQKINLQSDSAEDFDVVIKSMKQVRDSIAEVRSREEYLFTPLVQS